MKTVSDANLLEALRAADPAALITLTSADAAASTRQARPRRAPRRRWTIWATALTAVVVVGLPVGAVATGFAARTGWFGSPNPGDDRGSFVSTESDDTEWLDLGADDLPQVVASLYPEWLPLAPGVTSDALTARVTEAMTGMEGLAQETLVRRTYEYEAYRDWIGAWITAHDTGDTNGQTTAAIILEEAADWPAMVETDGGGVTDIMRAFAQRIADGDNDAAQALAQIENAPSWDGQDRSELGTEIYNEVLGANE
ncbi:hypothetical protein IFU08_15775 [Microbacterium sp. CFBP 8790]|uniref:hypothetical protein n=1 Tax=unclassified Microbacterium TaxID=2609290 RepID=UPI0017836D2F|nr:MULTISPECIES: hypothetical protein [unclassified Microbacterium]MBD8207355.1 hypothetical protein [Microbacterium sp. CFBP 8801]MBD8511016.1 hypothetical protein [Microbacterium sp. CFBP 8790]